MSSRKSKISGWFRDNRAKIIKRLKVAVVVVLVVVLVVVGTFYLIAVHTDKWVKDNPPCKGYWLSDCDNLCVTNFVIEHQPPERSKPLPSWLAYFVGTISNHRFPHSCLDVARDRYIMRGKEDLVFETPDGKIGMLCRDKEKPGSCSKLRWGAPCIGELSEEVCSAEGCGKTFTLHSETQRLLPTRACDWRESDKQEFKNVFEQHPDLVGSEYSREIHVAMKGDEDSRKFMVDMRPLVHHHTCPDEEHNDCCDCLSDEIESGDWDNGECCGHCTQTCYGE